MYVHNNFRIVTDIMFLKHDFNWSVYDSILLSACNNN